jgi:hypothetical protein
LLKLRAQRVGQSYARMGSQASHVAAHKGHSAIAEIRGRDQGRKDRIPERIVDLTPHGVPPGVPQGTIVGIYRRFVKGGRGGESEEMRSARRLGRGASGPLRPSPARLDQGVAMQ